MYMYMQYISLSHFSTSGLNGSYTSSSGTQHSVTFCETLMPSYKTISQPGTNQPIDWARPKIPSSNKNAHKSKFGRKLGQ